jgi:hypothetical protein
MLRQKKLISINDYGKNRYMIKNGDFRKFEGVLASKLMSKFNCENNKEDVEKIDQELCDVLNLYEKVDGLVDTALPASQQRVIQHSRYKEERSMQLKRLPFPGGQKN